MNRKELEVLFGIVIAASLLVLAVSSVRDRTIREQQPQDGPAEVQQVEQLPAGQLPAVDAPTVPPDAILANPGYRPRPEKTEGFLKTLRRPTLREANPDLFRGARGPPRAKEPILLYRALYDAHRLRFGSDWKVGSQGIGDCFVIDTMVTMADGSERPIQDVRVGDYVMSHHGTPRRVIDTFQKSFTGTLVTIRAKGYDVPVTATDDHRFVAYPGIPFGRGSSNTKSDRTPQWRPIGELKVGDRVLISKINAEHQASELVCDGPADDFGWLFGMYLAEGGLDRYENGLANRITFSLGRHEPELIGKLCGSVARQFGTEPSVDNLPSKPSVSLVRLSSVRAAQWIQSLCDGNVYSKSVPGVFFSTAENVRSALIRGWLDGDGHEKIARARGGYTLQCQGVSASTRLLRDMYRLALSCDIRSSLRMRGDRPDRAKSGDLFFYGESALRLFPEMRADAEKAISQRGMRIDFRDKVDDGIAAPIKSIKREEVVDHAVYCITVEQDHSFIANGYGVHNCVSWGWAHGADIHLAVLWKLGVSSEWKPAATEAIYGGSRVEAEGVSFGGWSDGSYGGSAAKWVRDWGILYRQPYGEIDLTTYSSKRAKDWGAYGCGGQKDAGKLDDVAKKHPVRHVALVTTFDDAAAAISSGYPVPVCSNQGFAKVRDKDGFARASGSWAHCFLPGTMFSTLIPKPCEEVMQGDLVVTHAGHLMPADQVIKSQYSGPITTIRATGCLDVSATNGHPILIYRPMDSASANPQAKPDVDFVTYAGGSYKSLAKKKSEYDKSQPMWVAIEDVRRGDYLLTPRRLKRHPYAVPEWVYSPRAKQRPPLPVDSDVAFLLGNYVANGDAVPAHKIRITMPLNAPYLPRLASACQKLGLEFTAKDESGWTMFVVYDATVANSFRQWCGTTSETKHVPEFMYGDGWDWKAFLDGYVAGDGTRLLNLSTERYRTTSVSQSLSFQVWQMAVDLGMYPIMTKIKADRPGAYANAKESYGVDFGECQIHKSTRYWQDYYCMPVRESTPGNYEGMVYNLEVPGDETYLANGIVAHNCMCFVAVRYEPRPGLLCLNSWGTSWISGPKYPDDQPDGSFWVDAETATRMLRGRDSFAVSGIEGFPYRNLDNADWVRLVPRNGSVVESFALAP